MLHCTGYDLVTEQQSATIYTVLGGHIYNKSLPQTASFAGLYPHPTNTNKTHIYPTIVGDSTVCMIYVIFYGQRNNNI